MLNKVTFQGRFTADPELRQTASGVFFCNFDVAWSEKYKEVESTCFLKQSRELGIRRTLRKSPRHRFLRMQQG